MKGVRPMNLCASYYLRCIQRELEALPDIPVFQSMMSIDACRYPDESIAADALRDLPNVPLAHCLRGEHEWIAQRYDNSLLEFRIAQKSWQSCPWGALGIIRSLLGLGRVDDAWTEFMNCTGLHAQGSACVGVDAEAPIATEMHEKATNDSMVGFLQKVIESRIRQVLMDLALALEDLERWDKANQVYLSACALMDACQDGLLGIARCQRSAGRVLDAIKTLEHVIANDPNSMCAYVNLGHCYLDTGRPLDAVRVYKRVRAAVPDQEECGLFLAKAYSDSGDYEEALRCLDDLMSLPRLGISNEYRGYIFGKQGRYREALDQYERSLEACPGMSEREREDIVLAIEECRKKIGGTCEENRVPVKDDMNR
jgi:lipopolysaccharide biosynthesis regulator YciM